jgi:MFS family permease
VDFFRRRRNLIVSPRFVARFADFFRSRRKLVVLRRFVTRFANFLRPRRNLIVLLVTIFVIGAGQELWMRFVPKYLQALGVTVFVIGLYDGLRTLLSAAYAYRGGALTDLWGHRRVFIIFNLVSTAGYALVLFIPNWGGVIAGMFLFLSWSCVSLPATFSLLGATLAAERHSIGVSTQSVIGRLPIMIAPFFGGMLIDRFGVIVGVRIALIISILLSAATIFVQWQLREEPKEKVAKIERWNFWRSVREFNHPLRRLLLSDVLVGSCERIPYAWVVIFAMDYIGISGREIGMLTTVEIAAAALCIMPASYFADKFQREPIVVITFIMFALFPISLLFSHGFTTLAVAFAIRGLKEFGDTSRKALILGYCQPERRGQMVGAYYLVRDLIVSVGALVGAYLWKLGPRLNFLAAAALGVVGTLFYIGSVRQARAMAPPIMLYGRRPSRSADENKLEM